MSDVGVEQHVLYALRNAEVRQWPFPHFFVTSVFPYEFYRDVLLPYLEVKGGYAGKKGHYEGRLFADTEDLPKELDFMKEPEFLRQVSFVFAEPFLERYAKTRCDAYSELRLVRDGKGYSIGPHTDAVWKLVSLLFYLPGILENLCDCGTALYVPKAKGRTCEGGPHHRFEEFEKVWQAPFIPNACLGFFKTNNSFHGVEPIDREMRRDVLLFNIYDKAIYLEKHPPKG